MRAPDPSAPLDADAAAVADRGLKAMIPIGRPFLDYILSALADAGFADVCLVIGPEHQPVRDYYYGEGTPSRIRLHFAVQEKPLGTADAVLAAEQFAGADPFVVINSDNYYPPAALAELSPRADPAMVAFSRDAMVDRGVIAAEKAARFGAVRVGENGMLLTLTGDPAQAAESTGGALYASMNCWLFDSTIFAACRAVPNSARGEKELTQAVQYAIDELGMRFQVVCSDEPVLDLSSRGDIRGVAGFLQGIDPRP